MKYDLRQLTNVQLFRLMYRLFDRLDARMGYQPFGYDRQTLRLTEPGWLEAYDPARIEFIRRGT